METGNRLLLLFVYYLIFMGSFYGAFKIKAHLDGRDSGVRMNATLFGRQVSIATTSDMVSLRFLFIMVCVLSFIASVFMIIATISYNFEVIKDPDSPIKEAARNLSTELKEVEKKE